MMDLYHSHDLQRYEQNTLHGDPLPYRCNACLEGHDCLPLLTRHKRECHTNRIEYLKLTAMKLSPMDYEAHKPMFIQYDYVTNEEPITTEKQEAVDTMKEQLRLWGGRALTKEFVWSLGTKSCEEPTQTARKRKRRLSDDLLPVNPCASTTSHRTYHAPSPPPLEDLLPSPSFANTVSYTHPPALNVTHTQPQVQRQQSSNTASHSITQQAPESDDSAHLGDFTSSFDLAFAKWLDEENISKAAIGRLLKDPAMQPITSKLSWKSMSKMKDRLKSVKFYEDREYNG